MFGLPVDVLRVIKEFSGPIMTRADWRTCKRHEAEIVEEKNERVLYYLDKTKKRWNCNPEETHEINHWTLYGKKWLMRAPEWRCIAQRRPPLIPPKDGMYKNPNEWYAHRIQWLNQ
jgi:hypothetical protein